MEGLPVRKVVHYRACQRGRIFRYMDIYVREWEDTQCRNVYPGLCGSNQDGVNLLLTLVVTSELMKECIYCRLVSIVRVIFEYDNPLLYL
jgi:hypothetical protein